MTRRRAAVVAAAVAALVLALALVPRGTAPASARCPAPRTLPAGAPLAPAVARLRPGQALLLAPGVHGRRGRTTTVRGRGTPGCPTTLAGVPGRPRPVVLGRVVVSGAGARLRRLALVGPTGRVARPGPGNPGGEDVQLWLRGRDVTVEDSVVRDNAWHAGVYVTGGTGIRLRGNRISSNGAAEVPARANLDHGVYWASGSGEVRGNVVEGNVAFGVHLYPAARRVLVAGNRIVGNGRAGVIVADRSAGNVIRGNVIAFNRDGALATSGLTGAGNVAEGNRTWRNGTRTRTDGLVVRGGVEQPPD